MHLDISHILDWSLIWSGIKSILKLIVTGSSEITKFIANLGIIAGSIVAILTFKKVSLRTYENQLDNQFREFYTFFWQDEKVSEGRKLVSYEHYIDQLAPFLRIVSKKNPIKIIDIVKANPELLEIKEDEQRNEKISLKFRSIVESIEAVDCFFAAISRATIHGALQLTNNHKDAYRRVFIDYWLKHIFSVPVLADYYLTHWCEPLGQPKTYKTYAKELVAKNSTSAPTELPEKKVKTGILRDIINLFSSIFSVETGASIIAARNDFSDAIILQMVEDKKAPMKTETDEASSV